MSEFSFELVFLVIQLPQLLLVSRDTIRAGASQGLLSNLSS